MTVFRHDLDPDDPETTDARVDRAIGGALTLLIVLLVAWWVWW